MYNLSERIHNFHDVNMIKCILNNFFLLIRWRTLRGVKILRINTKYNILWTLGVGIPGETGAMCYLFDTVLPLRKLKTPPPFPTQPLVDDLPLEYYDESIHMFERPTITFEES